MSVCGAPSAILAHGMLRPVTSADDPQPDPVREVLAKAGRPVRAEDDSVVLYHATSVDGARFVLEERRLATRYSTEGVYVSTGPAIVSLRGDWAVVVPVRVKVGDLEPSRDWFDHEDPELRRADFRISVQEDGSYKPIAVGRAAYDSLVAPTGPMPDGWDI
jgi:hypothetical protein